MIAALAKFIDWSSLQLAYAAAGINHAPQPGWKLAEAMEFLNGPDFIPAACESAQITRLFWMKIKKILFFPANSPWLRHYIYVATLLRTPGRNGFGDFLE